MNSIRLFGAACAVLAFSAFGQTVTITADRETEAVSSTGDSADDSCLWVHPEDPAQSVIIGTNKKRGLVVYDLEGRLLQDLQTGSPNNVDLRHDVTIGGVSGDIVAASMRDDDTVGVFKVDPAERTLVRIGAPIPAGFKVYGFCMYHNRAHGDVYLFANSKEGDCAQFKLTEAAPGQLGGEEVCRFHLGGQVEGCVADDALGVFYIGEEKLGIWRYQMPLEANGFTRTLVDTVMPEGQLAADVEGLTLYRTEDGRGYLIASSQGNDSYTVYRREGRNEYVGRFRIVPGENIDGTEETDGIDVCSSGLGSAFPKGVFVAQDGYNDGGNQNFKMVSWERLAHAFDPPLTTDGGVDAR